MDYFSDRKMITKSAIIIYSVVISLSLVACSAPKGNPENGRRWFNMNNCYSCHGNEGKNGVAPSLAGLEMGFGSFVKNLRKPNAGSKRSYSEAEISKQDAADMYAWLKGIHNKF